MNIKNLYRRELTIQHIRQFFARKKFQEITIPILNESVPLEPNIYPFQTTWKNQHETKAFFLPTSPESYLKRCVAKGIHRCFSIAPAFRNLEDTSPIHSPEFLMLEWYEEQKTIETLMNETKRLIEHCASAHKKSTLKTQEWKVLSIPSLFEQYVGTQLEECIEDEKMRLLALDRGYNTTGATWEQLFNQIFLNEIEVNFETNPCFVTDYPAKISPLCKTNNKNPLFAERFELYINKVEIANGNMENTDGDFIKTVFTKEKHKREKETASFVPIDENFLASLPNLQNKNVGGVGLGIDRLIMVLFGETSIYNPLR
jgi:lysyl-tRNA synthetase class 2